MDSDIRVTFEDSTHTSLRRLIKEISEMPTYGRDGITKRLRRALESDDKRYAAAFLSIPYLGAFHEEYGTFKNLILTAAKTEPFNIARELRKNLANGNLLTRERAVSILKELLGSSDTTVRTETKRAFVERYDFLDRRLFEREFAYIFEHDSNESVAVAIDVLKNEKRRSVAT